MLVLFFIGILVLLGIDQWTKLWVITHIKDKITVPLWQDVFHLTYWENRGAAFGILQNKLWLFIIITVVVVVGVLYYLIKHKPKSLMLNIALTLLIGGALGNFTDRVFRGYVVDFLHFKWIDFPIFNMADTFVVVGTALLAYYLIFIEGKKEQIQDDAV